MKRKLLYLLLLSLSSIVSSAQTQAYSDSVRCYTRSELQSIAHTILDGRECRELLPVCEKISSYRDSVIQTQEVNIRALNHKVDLKQDIIEGLEQDNKKLDSKLTKRERTIKWLKFGWITTASLLCAAVVLQSF